MGNIWLHKGFCTVLDICNYRSSGLLWIFASSVGGGASGVWAACAGAGGENRQEGAVRLSSRRALQDIRYLTVMMMNLRSLFETMPLKVSNLSRVEMEDRIRKASSADHQQHYQHQQKQQQQQRPHMRWTFLKCWGRKHIRDNYETESDELFHIWKIAVQTRGSIQLRSQLPSECDYLQSTRVYGDYQLTTAINTSTL